MAKLHVLLLMCSVMFICGCRQKDNIDKKTLKVMHTAYNQPPQWAQEAIWYQIFVDRFRKEGHANTPTLLTTKGALTDEMPADWAVTPWGHNWYQQETWAINTKLDFYRTIQMRRYGGDLQGVINKIGYLKDLGITAVYFNPLNDAPSLHKFDARNYHHIDVCFGNDRDGDLALISAEDKGDPSKWAWTNADKLFVECIAKMHEAGIKVVMDYSFNHTGTQFWAFQDIVKNGEKSKYKDWYNILKYDDASTTANEFDYEGWFGIKSLPEIKKIKSSVKVQGLPYEGNIANDIKNHMWAVCQRWMDPNGDGDPTDGIDGLRLDVAEHVPLGFWRDLRKHVRNINPNFYLVGENWWTKWPDQLMDPQPWVSGDVFDAVMHYHWYKPARAYINQGDDGIDLSQFYTEIESLYARYRPETQHAMMNLLASHDTERVLTSLNNKEQYKFKNKPQENKEYRVDKPSDLAYQKYFLLLLHQFTFVGSPHIWNGDEMGMWGADDPDNRRPMWWPDLKFEPESYPYSTVNKSAEPKFNSEIHSHIKALCRLRKSIEALHKGSFEFDKTLLEKNIMAYTRTYNGVQVKVYLNFTQIPKQIQIPQEKQYEKAFLYKATCKDQNALLEPFGGIVLVKK